MSSARFEWAGLAEPIWRLTFRRVSVRTYTRYRCSQMLLVRERSAGRDHAQTMPGCGLIASATRASARLNKAIFASATTEHDVWADLHDTRRGHWQGRCYGETRGGGCSCLIRPVVADAR
jgi:hypothetical protein